MVVEHVKQPNGYTCVPAVVAMITKEPIEALIAELRPTPKSGTPHKRLVRALKSRAVPCGDRFVNMRGRPLPHTCIVRVSWGKRLGHVVLKVGRRWFDPQLDGPFAGEPIMTVSGQRVWVNCARITSALWLYDGMP